MNAEMTSYKRFKVPPLSEFARDEFNTLVLDPYTGGKQRYRRFSQYRLEYVSGKWATEKLPHRPFIQAKAFNGVVGGVPRYFESLRFDPSLQVIAGVEAADFDKSQVYQFNAHQVRVVVDQDIKGVTVPEGPHRDGHSYVMNVVFSRSNISGGVSQLMPTGGGDPFFEDVLQENEAIIFDDRKMWHNATNILPLNERRGWRDIMIFTFNEWERRRYGEEFEKSLGLIPSDLDAAMA